MNHQSSTIQAIINPISGVGSKRKIPKMLDMLCEKAGIPLKIHFTEYAGHASELTQHALDEGASCILAVGGDGTVNEVARTMLYSDAILGILPRGSGNGLARELHIPMDVKKAVELLTKNHISTIDACKANDRIFFCTCGVGFDAAVSKKFASQKHRGSITYLRNTIEEYLSYKPEPYELLIDGRQINEKAFLVACGNASQYGNNAYIAPHANIQDGEMDVTILAPFTPLDIAPLAIQLFARQIDKNSKIRTMKARHMTIVRQQPGIMHLDGEPVEAGERIEIEVLPAALKVFTPDEVTFTQEVQHLFGQVIRFFDKNMPYIFK